MPFSNSEKATPEKTVHPLLISASRATDIPAFQIRWFMERLREGFFIRLNPYNRRSRRVETDRTRAVVFWSKNPAPLQPYLQELEERGLTCAIQFTLNDYEREGWEQGLPPLEKRIETFLDLAGRLKPGAVVWRFDPLALGPALGPAELGDRLQALAEKLLAAGLRSPEKLVFSFLDLYTKVRRRLARRGLELRPPESGEARIILEGLAALKEKWPGLDISSCAEAGDFRAYGLRAGACLEAGWLLRLRPELAGSPELFAPSPGPGLFGDGELKPLKDKGQRPDCRCLPSQDIGSYGTCAYGCVYCYASK